jgi:hypothetical protein
VVVLIPKPPRGAKIGIEENFNLVANLKVPLGGYRGEKNGLVTNPTKTK